jgi:hypothetical protein
MRTISPFVSTGDFSPADIGDALGTIFIFQPIATAVAPRPYTA